MARRKPRKNVGPQPHHNPKQAAAAAAPSKGGAVKRRPGEPHPPSLKGVAIRAAIVSALFYPYLVYVPGHSTPEALIITGIAFALMMPLGIVMDRFRYKRQMIRWEERRNGGRPPKPPKPPKPAAATESAAPSAADSEQ